MSDEPRRRPTATETTLLVAECKRCSWTSSAPNGLGHAARHHDATDHPVVIDVTRRVVYGDLDAPRDGQTSLIDAIDNLEETLP